MTSQRFLETPKAPLPKWDERTLQTPHNAFRSVCIVTTELPYLYKNGGIGSCNWHLAGLLRQHGWRVHLLYCGDAGGPAEQAQASLRVGQMGCAITFLHDCRSTTEMATAASDPQPLLDRSDRVRQALEVLHHAHHFSLIEFAEYQALGFRSIQAKRTGLAFDDVCMIVKLHSSSQWLREANLSWSTHWNDLLLDHCERYAFENADAQIAPCKYMLDYARSIGWHVKDHAQVVPYVFPAPTEKRINAQPSLDEVVFFGRLETRKGLELFLDAARKLPAKFKITLLGKEVTLSDGRSTGQAIKEALGKRRVTILSKFDRHEALEYLMRGNRLAVIPSLVDNSPNTVIECATHGIPFLAARTGGIPELLPDAELQEELLFEPNARAVFAKLDRYLHLKPSERQALTDRAREATDVAVNNEVVLARYHQLVQEQIVPAATASAAPPPVRLADAGPLVTVAVTYFNLAQYLPEALASLAAQTYANLEVLVIDDGSTSPVAVRVFEEQQRLYPQFRFLSQPNGGLSAARNLALANATGEYFLPVDADNVARPDMVATFVRGLQRNAEVSALSCYFLAFRESADLETENYEYGYRPTAGPHVLGAFRNVYGDANAIFRTADLRAINGYEPERDSTCEDWEAFVKLVNAGYRIDVVPEHLFFYRHRPESLLRSTHHYRNRRRVVRHYFQMESLPLSERIGLWSALGQTQNQSTASPFFLRHLVADRINRILKMVPGLHFVLRQLILLFWVKPDALANRTSRKISS